MGYTKNDWQNRLCERSDMSTLLTHLTRGRPDGKTALEILLKILIDKKLIGSTNAQGFICGNRPAVCFQDAPLYSIAQNVLFEQKMRNNDKSSVVRYKGMGVAFTKPYLYAKGARPVVYDNTDTAKGFLPEDEWWRIVRLDLSDENAFVDWTHEREWRLPGNLEFELSEVTLLAVKNKTVIEIAEKYQDITGDELRDEVRGIVTMKDILF